MVAQIEPAPFCPPQPTRWLAVLRPELIRWAIVTGSTRAGVAGVLLSVGGGDSDIDPELVVIDVGGYLPGTMGYRDTAFVGLGRHGRPAVPAAGRPWVTASAHPSTLRIGHGSRISARPHARARARTRTHVCVVYAYAHRMHIPQGPTCHNSAVPGSSSSGIVWVSSEQGTS